VADNGIRHDFCRDEKCPPFSSGEGVSEKFICFRPSITFSLMRETGRIPLHFLLSSQHPTADVVLGCSFSFSIVLKLSPFRSDQANSLVSQRQRHEI
jgi:hypothetical protein